MWRSGPHTRRVVGQVKRRRFDGPGEICTLVQPGCERPTDVLHPPLSGNLQIPAEGFPEVEPSASLLFQSFGNSLLIGPKVYRLAGAPTARRQEARRATHPAAGVCCALAED